MPGADGVRCIGHDGLCGQEAVRRLLGLSRLEMKVKPKILASAVERTRRQAAGAFPRRVWESAVGAGLREAQDPRQDWVRTLGAVGGLS